MKAVVSTFNQEKAILGAFSVIVKFRRLIVYSSSHQPLVVSSPDVLHVPHPVLHELALLPVEDVAGRAAGRRDGAGVAHRSQPARHHHLHRQQGDGGGIGLGHFGDDTV